MPQFYKQHTPVTRNRQHCLNQSPRIQSGNLARLS